MENTIKTLHAMLLLAETLDDVLPNTEILTNEIKRLLYEQELNWELDKAMNDQN
jgi:hypothetical protein